MAENTENFFTVDEEDLVRQVKQNPQGFDRLYLFYVDKVFRYLYNRIGNRQDAEDVTTQTFMAALRGFEKYKHNGQFSAWLFSIARNKSIDFFRQHKDLVSIEDYEQKSVDNDPLNELIYSEKLAILSKLIGSLPEKERELLRLRFLAQMKFSEIAHLMNRSENAVKKEIYRLVARLQAQVEVSND